ncbi:DUF4376 domain-containing protein [Aureimonas phyllosphaerae]|uniref:DUF4376 domain-containing protein n=1 Tax=Aureimonas phyllosphaerae TaxID=1166078 RepID=A0A7W6FW99_9HYPH|nr:DUF4376 domain-containing protein [Aureimonas phyllosphaerae]MBB3937665.1 hypothetical protein [Aureimonas phyllosphaerae]MBB3961799.1 hypothetical protein [Aureimonas phyllosphaerae]SFF44894.1 protein of unknown function [Aureimonas phyllosphaerae]
MAQAQKIDGEWRSVSGGPVRSSVDGEEVVASFETIMLWSEDEREAFGVFPVGDGDPVPAGKRVVSSRIVDRNGRPVWLSLFEDEPAEDVGAAIEAEKVRRIEAGFPFLGKVIQSRAEDRENIAGAKSAAQDAKLLGAETGELSWQKRLDATKGAEVFAWITLDNSLLPLDADAMIAMGYAAMLHKQRLIFVAKSIKDRIAAGEAIADVTADALWG